MDTYILKENVLTDDLLYLATVGKVFKGQYIAIVKEYTFLNSWSDKENIKRFRNEKTLRKYLTKKYPRFNYYS
jgi:hypothetical protein